jgi:dimethylglycine catabolism A
VGPPLDHLFSPLSIGAKRTRNRIAVTAHNLNWDHNGLLTREYVDYCARRAAGGAGIVMCFGAASVHRAAGEIYGRVSLWDPRNEAPLRELADAAHEHGALLMSQVNHVGRRGTSAVTERPLLAPSGEPEPAHREVPHELTAAEIADIVASFADAAQRLHRCGWDGVEITSFGGQLIEQFWSPTINRRTDEYGGSFLNRMRFGVEVIEAVRAAVPSDFVVGFRMTGDPLGDELGLSPHDMLTIGEHLDRLGLLDLFNISGGTGATLQTQAGTVPPDTFDRGCYLPLAKEMKEQVSVPVLSAGRILDVEQAEAALARGDCDLVAMTRATLADPDLPNLAQRGEVERIRPCIAINDACIGRSYKRMSVRCAVNPVLGHDALDQPPAAPVRQRVLVVGGGPAGMEAARVAAARGHEVVLLEESDHLGGQIAVARQAPHRPHLGRHIEWLARELHHGKVEVRLNRRADADAVAGLEPDVVVVATGAESRVPAAHGHQGAGHLTDVELLNGQVDVAAGAQVVVYDREGGIRGGSAAITAAERGAQVLLVTPLQSACQDLDPTQLPFIRRTLTELDVAIMADTELVQADDRRLLVRDVWTRQERAISSQTTVFVGFHHARSELLKALDAADPPFEVRGVGDCVAPRTLMDAVREGALAGAAV